MMRQRRLGPLSSLYVCSLNQGRDGQFVSLITTGKKAFLAYKSVPEKSQNGG